MTIKARSVPTNQVELNGRNIAGSLRVDHWPKPAEKKHKNIGAKNAYIVEYPSIRINSARILHFRPY